MGPLCDRPHQSRHVRAASKSSRENRPQLCPPPADPRGASPPLQQTPGCARAAAGGGGRKGRGGEGAARRHGAMGDREYDASGVDEDDKAGPAFESLRETTLFLIDGSRPMFERAGDEARPEMTHFDRALELLEGFMKQRIITADNDKIGAMVYGTRVSKNQSAFEMVYTLIDVDIPEAKQIKMIKGMIGASYPLLCGCLRL
mmetsp:Transcript_5942/g.20239  ORF Transcript_5942/g.20239 Transcript_5942/m.20239 type:complete len:202 (-) Transcript_5942:58-663(-)